jgi:hypothetical protein
MGKRGGRERSLEALEVEGSDELDMQIDQEAKGYSIRIVMCWNNGRTDN